MKMSFGSGHTQEPSTPQVRPDAAQLGVQQRIVPPRSGAQRLVPHWVLALHAWPLPSRPVQTPVAGLQPLPQAVAIRSPFSQRSAVFPEHEEPAPSQSTQTDPSVEQNAPAQGPEQHTLPPATVAMQDPDAHSAFVAQVWPSFERQFPATSC
jgi:hypothetical protein